MHIYSTELVRAYRAFKALDPADPLALVHHYEKHEAALVKLDQDQSFDCLATYTDALFQAEMYRKHIVMCEYLLEVIIMENITSFHGEDVYQSTLLRKACSHRHLNENAKAQEVLEALLAINPDHKAARFVLANFMLQEQPIWYQKWTSFYIGFILLAACSFVLSACLKLFGKGGSFVFAYAGLALVSAAIVAMLGTRLYHTWNSYAYPRHLARKLMQSKRTETIENH
jgi:hypothetical protein